MTATLAELQAGLADIEGSPGDDGHHALRFVSTPALRDLRLRGMYAIVVRSGDIKIGDRVGKA